MFNWINKIKESLQTPVMTIGNAKILALLAIIHCDDKANIDREMQLFDALCVLDDRVDTSNMHNLKETFSEFEETIDELFLYISENLLERHSKINLLASAYLIASIDEYVSNKENKLLVKMGQILQLTLEEINMVLEHTAYVVECFNEWFFP